MTQTYPIKGQFGRIYINATDGFTLTFTYELAGKLLFTISAMFNPVVHADRGSYFEERFANEERRERIRLERISAAEKLAIETQTHGDIVLVDVVDVYRNVPMKLIQAVKW